MKISSKRLFFPESSQAAKYGGCFSGDSTVLTATGRRRLSDLQIGEFIQALDSSTNQLVFSEVLLFLDYDPQQKREFLYITLSSGRTLTITPSHLVLLDDWTAKYAEKLRVGDSLLVSDSKELIKEKIVRVEGVWRTGVYAPLTAAGTVIVDGVAASCYATIDSQWLAHWAFSPIRLAHNVHEGLGRLWTAVSRPLGGWTGNETRAVAKPTTGIFWYAKMLYITADFFIPSHLYE